MNTETLVEKMQRIARENEGVAELKEKKMIENEAEKIYNRLVTYIESAAKDGHYNTSYLYGEGYNKALGIAVGRLTSEGFKVDVACRTMGVTRLTISWKPSVKEQPVEKKSFLKRIFG